MFAVRIHRFSVLRDGKTYHPGDIIQGLTEEEAKKLANESNGEIEIVTVISLNTETSEEPTAPEEAKAPKKSTRGGKDTVKE